MGDLKDSRLIYLKGFLFLIIIILCSILILYKYPDWHVAALLGICIWASARLYYFMFYVIEHYVDPSYKFSGIYDFVKYLFKKNNS